MSPKGLDSATLVTYSWCNFSATAGSPSLNASRPEDRMPVLLSKTRPQGASIVTTLPAEVARRLSIEAGQQLEWIEDGLGGFRVVPHTPELAEAFEAHAEVMAEYDSVFRALAK